MRAWVLEKPGPIESAPLALRELPDPEPGPRRGLRRRRGLRALPHRPARGGGRARAARARRSCRATRSSAGSRALGAGARRFALGARVGVAWLWRACGACAYCARGAENLCRAPTFTGWHRDGGFAERVVAPEDVRLPAARRARRRRRRSRRSCARASSACARCAGAASGRAGGSGCTGSARRRTSRCRSRRHEGARVFAVTREASHRELARALGAEWAGDLGEAPPEPLDAAVLFAPAGALVPVALAALAPGRHARLRGHPHERDPGARLRGAPLRGAHTHQCHRQHARRRPRAARARRADPAAPARDGAPVRARERRPARR